MQLNKSLVLKICGTLGLFGCFAVIAGNIIGILLHEKHDPVSDTISMLAIGKYGWIQDTGLDILGIGFFALGVGLYTWKNKGAKWVIGSIILLLIGADLFLIAEHNQYAGRPGHKIHRILVYILAGLFLILNFLMSSGLKDLRPYLKKFSISTGVLWLIFAPLLPLIPDNLDGAYERLVCTLLVIWPATISYHLIKISSSKN